MGLLPARRRTRPLHTAGARSPYEKCELATSSRYASPRSIHVDTIDRRGGPNSDLLPGLAFILIWSAGYIAASYGLTGMGPFTLATLRFVGSGLIIALLVVLRQAPRPSLRLLLHATFAGVLLQAGFFGFTYEGLRLGAPPATAGLVVGLMPLTTALGATLLLGEPMLPRAMLGLALGLAGVLLVIAPGLRGGGALLGHICFALALASLSLGTLYQKRRVVGADPGWSMLAQLGISALIMLPPGLILEGLQVQVSAPAMAGLAWVILVNSAAGLLLYLVLLARSGAARVASLFYLVPPASALMAAVFLHAHFGVREGAGFALAATGVWLGQRPS